MAATGEMEPVPKEKPFLRCIFLPHGEFPENPQPLLDKLTDTNILFLEAVGFTQTSEERARTEQQFNFALADLTRFPEFQDAQHELITQLWSTDNFGNRLVASLGNTGKRIFLVDIDKNHPSLPLLVSVKNDTNLVSTHLEHGHVKEAQTLFRDLCLRRSTLHRIREEEVKTQIEKIVTRLEQQGVTVRAAVVQGLIHTPTATLFDTNRFSIETAVFSIPVPLQAQIWMNLRNGNPVNDIDYDRALLIDHLLPLEENQGDWMNALTSEQVTAAFSQFDRFYHQVFYRLTGHRRLSQEEKDFYYPYAFDVARTKLLETIKQWV